MKIKKIFTNDFVESVLVQNDLPVFKYGQEMKWDHPALLKVVDITTYGKDEIKRLRNEIKSINGSSGVYFYVQGNKILYIGKATNLKDRIISHFQEMHHNHKDTPIFWELFFSHFKSNGPIHIYAIETDNKKDAAFLETIYHSLVVPEFEDLFKKFLSLTSRQNPRGKIKYGTNEYVEFENIFLKCRTTTDLSK